MFYYFLIVICFFINYINVGASDIDITGFKVGNQIYDNLEDAIINANSTDVISLMSDAKLNDTLNIKKTVNIDLNNHNIEASEKVFLINGGSLKLTGKGKVRETNPNYGAITLIGSNDKTKKYYSTVSVSSDVTLEGWSGIFITHDNKTSYGVVVNMNGDINAVNDINGGPGAGIYVNGNIKHEENSPIINLSDTVNITSTGNGIYSAGYATYNINGAHISGVEAGLGIKSGIFNILNATIIGTGSDETPTTGNNNGINASGTAIQIESNPGYRGNIELNIKKGSYISNNSYVIYEYTTKSTPTKIKKIELNGGTYNSKAKKDVFMLSDSFKHTHPNFITGGNYSSDPTTYLESGYITSKDNNSFYTVISNTMSVFAFSKTNNTKTSKLLLFILIILIIIIYFNRVTLLNFINKRKNKTF